MSSQFCPRCGKARAHQQAFCSGCGNRFTSVPTAAHGVTVPPPPAVTPSHVTPPPLPGSKALFADEVAPAATIEWGTAASPSLGQQMGHSPVPGHAAMASPAPDRPTGRGPLWALVAVLVVAVLGLGWLAFVKDDPADPADASATRTSDGSTPAPPADETPTTLDGPAVDLSSLAVPTAPDTAPAGEEAGTGVAITYDAANMLDGDLSTGWRVNTDGTSMVLTFTFPQPVRLDRVGLVNGYVKRAGAEDYYALYRRIKKATWTFDDGTSRTQELGWSRSVQPLDVSVVTTSVRLRIDEVTGTRDPRHRDRTTISEVEFTGSAS